MGAARGARVAIPPESDTPGHKSVGWTAAGMLEAERQFRRIIGYRDLAKLAVAIERDLATQRAPHMTTEPAIILSA